MTESAAESYRAFQRLRNRFNAGNEARMDGRPALHQDPNKEISQTPRKIDIHSQARLSVTHLVSVVEEGDLLQQSLCPGKLCGTSKTIVKGRWKHSDLAKSNHLNSPGFDSLEIASVTSCSSAYSSMSDSSLTSSSTLELLDTGSCDTHQEYEIKSHKVQIGKEKCWGNIDVSANDETSLPVFPTNHTFDENIPCNFVKKSTKVWNNLIGDWTFNKLSPAPTSVYKYRVTNEIMVPIPLETIEKNLKCGRGNSLPSEVSPSNISKYHLSPVPPGKFTWKIKCSTSNLISFFESLSCKRDSESD